MSDAPTPPPNPQKPNVVGTVPSPVGGPRPAFDAPEPLVPPEAGRYVAHTFHMPGGMGRVWKATDTELGRDVALKEIRPKHANDETARRRFEFEAELTGRLEHPAIIPVYGFRRDPKEPPIYAMRFVEGQTLHDRLTAFHVREWPNAAARLTELRRLLGHFVTVCRAVAYAHSRGVIHRDLKPANVMVGAFGETFVLDWGIAKRLRAAPGEATEAPLDGDDETDLSKSRRSARTNQIGTPGSWAPEQLAGTPDLHDERTDVYGLGAILFALLTGSSPHPLGVHPPDPRSARAVRSWVDASLDAIVTKALALERADRYQRAEDVALAVEEWLADQPFLAQRAVVATLTAEAATNPTNRALNEELARQHMNLGLMLSGTGRDEAAVAEFRACAAGLVLLHADSREPRLLADRAAALLAAAQSLSSLGRADEALQTGREAAQLYEKLVASDPDRGHGFRATLTATQSQLDIELPPVPASAPALEPPSYASAFDFALPEEVNSFSEIEPLPSPSASEPEPGTGAPLPSAPTKGPFVFVPFDSDADLPVAKPIPEAQSGAGALPPVPASAPAGSVPDISILFPAPARSPDDSVPDIADLFELEEPPPTPPPTK